MGTRRGVGQGQGLGQGPRFDSRVEPPKSNETDGLEELRNLKEQHQAAQKTLSVIEEKIAALESRK